MTVRDIGHHLQRVYGTELSHDTISKITDEVLDEVKAWQHRPLDSVYPVVFIDALVVKVRDQNVVRNKACHVVIGVDTDGVKHVLGLWVQQAEGAKFWAGVLAELRNRGVRDVLIACCDGLPGLPEAIEATWPHTVVQTCVVHLIRASLRYVSYKDRRAVAAALKPIYTAVNAEHAFEELTAFSESELGRRYGASVAVWERAWERFTPFLAFAPEVRKVIYTTNSIESLNYQLRKIIKNRGHFPNDDAVIKLLRRRHDGRRARVRGTTKIAADSRCLPLPSTSHAWPCSPWPAHPDQDGPPQPDELRRKAESPSQQPPPRLTAEQTPPPRYGQSRLDRSDRRADHSTQLKPTGLTLKQPFDTTHLGTIHPYAIAPETLGFAQLRATAVLSNTLD